MCEYSLSFQVSHCYTWRAWHQIESLRRQADSDASETKALLGFLHQIEARPETTPLLFFRRCGKYSIYVLYYTCVYIYIYIYTGIVVFYLFPRIPSSNRSEAGNYSTALLSQVVFYLSYIIYYAYDCMSIDICIQE